MARKRKKKGKGDPLGQWKEFFQEEGKGEAGTPDAVKREPAEEEAPGRAAEEPEGADETEEGPPGGEEVEAEMEEDIEVEGEAKEEAYIEPAPGPEPYWKEENGGGKAPLSAWEESLNDATREPEDEEEAEMEEEEDEDAFAWPTVEDVKNETGGEEPPDAPDSETGPEPGPPETAGKEEPPESPSSYEEEKVMEENSDALPMADTGDLGRIQQSIESVIQELSQLRSNRAGEVLNGLSKAGEILEAQHRRVMDLLRNNDILAREARANYASVEKRREVRKDLEKLIGELRDANEQLRGAGERLEGERSNLTEQKNRSSEDNSRMKGETQSLREAIDRLTSERVGLDEETAELEKKRDRLEEDVRRLTKLKEEYLANLARFREDE